MLENITCILNGHYINGSHMNIDFKGPWNTYFHGKLVTSDTVVNTININVDLNHLVLHDDKIFPGSFAKRSGDRFVKVLKYILENITVKSNIRICMKGIPIELMNDMNQNLVHHPFRSYFDKMLSFRENVLHRVKNWGLNVTFDFVYTSALITQREKLGHNLNYTWNPTSFKNIKPAGAMFAKARKERLDILAGCLEVLDKPEFIYSICKMRSTSENYKQYDWIRSGAEVGHLFNESIFHNSFVDPNLNTGLPTGFNNPMSFYNQICLEIVSETGASCHRCDVSEKITRPMLYGMPFLTNAWYDYVLRKMGGQSYWDLLNIKLPEIRHVDHDLRHDDITTKYINFTKDHDNGRYYSDYNMSDFHSRLHVANTIMGIQDFRKKCTDPGFVRQVKNVIKHNQQIMLDHNQKYDLVMQSLHTDNIYFDYDTDR